MVCMMLPQAEGQARFSSESFLEQGIAPHIVIEIGSWADKTRDDFAAADTPPAEPDKPAAEQADKQPPQRAADAKPAPATHRPFTRSAGSAERGALEEHEGTGRQPRVAELLEGRKWGGSIPRQP
jgi:hypothetical protein